MAIRCNVNGLQDFERPHQTIGMKYPAELYSPSLRPYRGITEPEYPFHDRVATVTHCRRICIGKRHALEAMAAGYLSQQHRVIGPADVHGSRLSRAAEPSVVPQPLQNRFLPAIARHQIEAMLAFLEESRLNRHAGPA